MSSPYSKNIHGRSRAASLARMSVDFGGRTQISSSELFHPNESRNPMARVRCITEMGMGVDVHGKDTTKAARRAVSDAIRHSSLGFFRMVGKTSSDMFVDVTIAVPSPDAVDTSAVAKELPYGTVTVKAVKGGLEIPAESGGDAIIIANAAVIVSLDDGASGQA
jgi:uncharacterized protein (TIGR02058 family)